MLYNLLQCKINIIICNFNDFSGYSVKEPGFLLCGGCCPAWRGLAGILWGLKFWDLRGVVDKIGLPFSLAGILRLILSEKAWIW